MNTLRNQVQLFGHLGKDLDMKTFDSGNSLAKTSIATNEFYRNKEGEKVQDTQWHNVVAWGKTAELMNTLLKKGDEVAVQGKLVHRQYEDGNGETKYISEVVVSEFVKITKAESL